MWRARSLEWDGVEPCQHAHADGIPVVVHATTIEAVAAALARPEVACVLVDDEELLTIDLPNSRMASQPVVATYSICACDLDAGTVGRRDTVEVPRSRLGRAVGGAARGCDRDPVLCQSALRAGRSRAPRDRLPGRRGRRRGCAADAGATTQLGIVDAGGRAATFTGSECHGWAGGRIGDGYAAQGNILVSDATVAALAGTFVSTAGRPLAVRLLDCLAAAQAAGGDKRGQQSAALLVVERDGGYASLSDTLVDLRIDDHQRPVEELRRLFGLHEALFGRTPRDEWLAVDENLRAEIGERLTALGHATLEDWAGVENLEERVDGSDRIDPVVLAALREAR